MTLDMWMAVGLLVVAVVLFISEKLRVDVVALGVVVLLMLSGLLTTEEALSGFSSTAVLTIGALFIVGGGVMNTGLAGTIGRRILAIAGNSERRLIVVLMGAVFLLSSVMSDTGTVAVLLPAAIVLARNANISPSRLLIPLSFGSLLGGASTIIGTPPNIIVSDALAAAGFEAFGFFTYTPMALVLGVTGILYMTLVGRRLLPDRRPPVDMQRVPTPTELVSEYRLPDQLLRLRVRRGSAIIGRTVAQTELGRDFGVVVLQILRPTEPRPAFQFARAIAPGAGRSRELVEVSNGDTGETVVQLDDVLIVKGHADDVAHAAARWNLGVQPAATTDEAALIDREVGVAEVLLPRRSTLVGKTLAEERFGSTYKLTVLNIQRPGEHESLELATTRLAFGDILLVQGPWEHIAGLKGRRRDFVVIGQPEAMIEAPRREKAKVALFILAAMVAAMIAGVASLTAIAMVAGLAMVLTGCLTMDEAYEFIDWRSLFLIAGMLPLSTALEKAGVVEIAAQGLVQSLGVIGPLAVLAGLFLFTSAFTQVISNTATTVIVAPLAVASASQLGVQPYAFLMAIALAASMAFATPVASPTNTLVMGAGHYTFGDYVRVGVPLVFIAMVEVVLILPLLFPF